ncbi:MAG: AarF/ABC1/UbiB kinase family protein [archaeon]
MKLKRGIQDLKRTKEIFEVFFSLGFARYLKRINEKEKLFSRKFKENPQVELRVSLRLAFEKLGGAFIKLGQMLSLRQDLLPKEYCEELSKLQDSVPPVKYSEAKKIIESELGRPISEVFKDFSKEPIAAASIGQVYSAILHNNKKVAVKVQRPNIKMIVEEDIDIMYFAAHLLEKHFKKLPITPVEIVKEFEDYTYRELDYTREAKSLDIFSRTSKEVKIPKVYWDVTTEKVLVMEFIEGKKLSTFQPKQGRIIAERFIRCIYNEVFVSGYFHADPHPGNIIITRDSNIALIDFGITGYLDEDMREKLTNLLAAIVEKDTEEITRLIIKMGVAEGSVDRVRLNHDLSDFISQYYDMPLKEIKLSVIMKGIITITKDNNLKLPKNLILLSKCAVTTESVVEMLDPDFSPVQNAKPFIHDILKKKYSPLSFITDAKKSFLKMRGFLFKFPEIGEGMMEAIERGEKSINTLHSDMNTLIVEMDKSSNRVALALIITALLIGAALMTNIKGIIVWGISLYSFIGFTLAFILLGMLLISVIGEVKI